MLDHDKNNLRQMLSTNLQKNNLQNRQIILEEMLYFLNSTANQTNQNWVKGF